MTDLVMTPDHPTSTPTRSSLRRKHAYRLTSLATAFFGLGLGLCLLLAASASASAAPITAIPSTAPVVTAGSHWTLVASGTDCFVVDFASGGKFTDDQGDKGTYSGTTKLRLLFQSGQLKDVTANFAFQPAKDRYFGTVSFQSISFPAKLVSGAKAGC